MSRHLVALSLALTIGASPLLLDLCAESCEAMHMTQHGTAQACHHESSPTLRVEPSPVGCGHDHGGPTLDVARDPGFSSRTIVAVLQVPSLAFAHTAPPPLIGGKAASPPPDRIAQSLGSSLRV